MEQLFVTRTGKIVEVVEKKVSNWEKNDPAFKKLKVKIKKEKVKS